MLEESVVWNRAETVLATMILITASLTVYLPIYLKIYALAPTTSVSGPISRNRSFGPIEGQEVSFAQAQASVSFKISLPMSMGTPVEIKLDLPPHSIPERVYIIYAAHKPSNDATTNDVLDQEGIILYEAPNLVTLQNPSQIIRAAINSTKNDPGGGLQEVNINGYVGCAGGTFSNCVTWYTETTFYELVANFNHPMQQLIEIAKSIPVK
jgi:hypothetical protein